MLFKKLIGLSLIKAVVLQFHVLSIVNCVGGGSILVQQGVVPVVPTSSEPKVSNNNDNNGSSMSIGEAYDGILETLSRTRVALRDLELDALVLANPFIPKDVSDIKFYLYTPQNPSTEQEIFIYNSTTLKNSYFDKLKPIKVLVHGYTQSLISRDFPQNVKDAYLSAKSNNLTMGYNVIVVDWSSFSKEFGYYNSVLHTKQVGERLAEFLIWLKDQGYITKFEDLHLIGFSLGSHVSGIAARYIASKYEGNQDVKIGRITGLDPAGPGYPYNEGLDPDDAEFVDVIHTNMGSILLGDFGTTALLGHDLNFYLTDFFPNGGKRQPGCEFSFFTEYSLPRRGTCSHVKAAEYFVKSIKNPGRYVGCKCPDWNSFVSKRCNCDSKGGETAVMGEYCCISSANGKYYLYTRK